MQHDLAGLLGSLLVGVITGLLSAGLATRRFRGEQWWTRKAESYTSILVALHEMKNFLKISLEDQIGNEAQSPERLSKLRANWTKGNDAVAKALDMGLLLSSSSQTGTRGTTTWP